MSTSPLPPPICPECSSPQIDPFLDPDSHSPLFSNAGHPLVQCRACQYIFPLTAASALALKPADLPGTPITTDRLCPHCNYNLRTLTIGHRCPECGNIITPSVHDHDDLNDAPHTSWPRWLIVSLVILGALGLFERQNHAGVALLYFAFGSACLWSGINSIRLRTTRTGRRPSTGSVVIGSLAIAIASLPILLGIAALSLSILILLGI